MGEFGPAATAGCEFDLSPSDCADVGSMMGDSNGLTEYYRDDWPRGCLVDFNDATRFIYNYVPDGGVGDGDIEVAPVCKVCTSGDCGYKLGPSEKNSNDVTYYVYRANVIGRNVRKMSYQQVKDFCEAQGLVLATPHNGYDINEILKQTAEVMARQTGDATEVHNVDQPIPWGDDLYFQSDSTPKIAIGYSCLKQDDCSDIRFWFWEDAITDTEAPNFAPYHQGKLIENVRRPPPTVEEQEQEFKKKKKAKACLGREFVVVSCNDKFDRDSCLKSTENDSDNEKDCVWCLNGPCTVNAEYRCATAEFMKSTQEQLESSPQSVSVKDAESADVDGVSSFEQCKVVNADEVTSSEFEYPFALIDAAPNSGGFQGETVNPDPSQKLGEVQCCDSIMGCSRRKRWHSNSNSECLSGMTDNIKFTLQEAIDLCASIGRDWTLCTREEIDNNVCQGKGCGHDKALVWAWDPKATQSKAQTYETLSEGEYLIPMSMKFMAFIGTVASLRYVLNYCTKKSVYETIEN